MQQRSVSWTDQQDEPFSGQERIGRAVRVEVPIFPHCQCIHLLALQKVFDHVVTGGEGPARQ